jgi:RNA polymerase sigma-70 factor, ECF subfamily
MIQATAEAKVPPSSPDPDAPDVAAAAAGDLRAAGQLYRRHSARVTRLARCVTGNPRDAEDVCQETFIRALGGLGRFRGQAMFRTWLSRIALNQARNALARRRTRLRLELLEGDSARTEPLSQRPVAELSVALSRALASLSERQREVLVCHDVLGMKHDEIAYMLGCASGTSKVQLHRARLRLRELLSPGNEA